MDHAGSPPRTWSSASCARPACSRHDLGREAFVARVWEWKEASGGQILDQMKRLGDGVDWTRERFTMDAGLSRAVQTIFKRLHDDELIYRAERIINWCPRCQTALSDIEVEHTDDEGELVELVYGGVDPRGEDRSWWPRPGSRRCSATRDRRAPAGPALRPLAAARSSCRWSVRMIRVVADDHVDPEFGTGAVKVTPAHDPERLRDRPAPTACRRSP